jgi:hypothetical protein
MNYNLKLRRKDYLKLVPRSHITGRGCTDCDYCRANRLYQAAKELQRIIDAEKEKE